MVLRLTLLRVPVEVEPSFVIGLSESDLVRHDGNDRVMVGGLEVELLHTPGSHCFADRGRMVPA